MRKLLIIWVLGLMISMPCFSQLRQLTDSSGIRYLVPISNIKKANLKFVELARLQEQEIVKDSIISLCYDQIDNYDRLLSVSLREASAERSKTIALEEVNRIVTLDLDDTQAKLQETKTKLTLWKLGYIPIVIIILLIK